MPRALVGNLSFSILLNQVVVCCVSKGREIIFCFKGLGFREAGSPGFLLDFVSRENF